MTYDIAECSFNNGKAGIAYVIHYLIENSFIDADYMDLYGDKHVEIVNDIWTRKYEKQEQSRYINDLFFINVMYCYLHKDDYCKCQDTIINNICSTMEYLRQQISLPFVAPYFYEYSARLLAVCDTTHFINIHFHRFLHYIEEIQDILDKKDIVCNVPSFTIQMYKYGVLCNNGKVLEKSKEMLKVCMDNMVVPALNFRQKSNLILSLCDLYTSNSSMDYVGMSNKVFDTLASNDIKIVEEIIYNQILRITPFAIGIYEGVSRLVLLLISYEQLRKGIYPKRLFGLFN